jgi:hypothetical protein
MTARLTAFTDTVVGKINEALPKLRECRSIGGRFNLDDLQGRSVKAPAVLVGVLRSPVAVKADNRIEIASHCGAFCLTEGAEEKRVAQAWTIAEAVLAVVGSTPHWGIAHVGRAEKLMLEPVLSTKIERRGVTLVAVTWTTPVRHIGEGLFDDQGHVPTDLYVNGELLIAAYQPGGSDDPA